MLSVQYKHGPKMMHCTSIPPTLEHFMYKSNAIIELIQI